MAKKNSEQLYLGKRDWLYIIAGMLFVMVLMLHYIEFDKSIIVWGDEFGYWSGAAYFLGIDWSEVASTNKFYGVGYGLFLAPIMKLLGHNAIIMKQAAVLMQAVLMSSCVFVAYYVCKCYYRLESELICIAISLISVCYVSNIVYVNIIQIEIFLCVLVWWSVFFLVRYILSGKNSYMFAMNILCVYSYFAHSRAIGLIAVAILINCYIIFRTQPIRTLTMKSICFFVSVVLIVACFLLVKIIRNNFIDIIYSSADYSFIEGNLETGKLSKLMFIFTKEGVLSLNQNFFGNIYYLLTGTIGIFGFFIVSIYKKVFLTVGKKSNMGLLELFSFLCFGIAFCICIAYWFGGDTRTYDRVDCLFYGRYYEYTLGPCLMIGLVFWIRNSWQNIKKIYMYISIVILSLSIFTSINISASGSLSNIWNSCTAIARYFYFYKGANKSIPLLVAVIIVAINVLLLFLLKKIKGTVRIVLVAFVCISIWFYNANSLVDEYVYKAWASELTNNQIDINDNLDESTNDIYVYEATLGGIFQFLNVYKNVHIVESIDELVDLDKGTSLITDKTFEHIDKIEKLYNEKYQNDAYIIWEKQY